MKSTQWWGYLHANGTPQLKRWFGDHEDYRGDCMGNPYVLQVVEPFEAVTETDAWNILLEKLSIQILPDEGKKAK